MKSRKIEAFMLVMIAIVVICIIPVFHVSAVNTWVGYVKPGFPDYAPSGMPDFDEKQPQFTTDAGHVQYSWCVPVAVADSLWWLDSQYESINYSNPVPPPTISDHCSLVTAYGPWDDHDPQNIFGLVPELAVDMHTDGLGIGGGYVGTKYADIQPGINTYLANHGVAGVFQANRMDYPVFNWIDQQVEACQDVELCLEFWYWNNGVWQPVTNPIFELGHCVACAGVNSSTSQVLVSDPYYNAFEAGLVPGRSPVPHTDVNTAVHNNASLVSQDAYTTVQFAAGIVPPPPGYPPIFWELQNYLQINGFTVDPNWHAFIRGAVATSLIPVHDVVVTNLTTCKDGCAPRSSVSRSYTAHANVTVANQGNVAETFNVTAYANETEIGQQTVTNLAAGSQAILTFLWNTTGCAIDNYTLSAQADTVSGETNTTNNSFTGGTLRVTIVGDVNCDNKVDIRDVHLIAVAYGTPQFPGDPNYFPNGDINDDHKIDIRDVHIAAVHYGDYYP